MFNNAKLPRARRFAGALLIAAVAFSGAASSSAAESFSAKVSGAGRPMILVPGLACNGSVWDETVARLKSQYECHVLSIAGFGGSEPLAGSKEKLLETVAADLAAYIRERGLEKPILVGHSLGGFLALSLASQQPELCGPLVLVDSLPFMPAAIQPGATAEAMRPMAAAHRDGMISNTGSMSQEQAVAMLQTMVTDPERIQIAATMSRASDSATVAHAMYALQTTDLREAIAAIQSPALVLGAWIAYRDFGATRESTEAIFTTQYRALPDHRVAMTDSGKHFIMWDDPEFFFAQVETFLAAHP